MPAATSRTPQAVRRSRSETKILSAALRLIAHNGVDGLTLAQAGESAGYSRGLPAHLFGSRAELLRRCALIVSEEVWPDMPPPPAQGEAFSELRQAIGEWFDLLTHRADFARAYFMLAAASLGRAGTEPFHEVMRSASNRAQERFARHIAAGRDSGEFCSGVDPAAQSWLIHATLRGAGLQWLLKPDAVDLARLTEVLLDELDGRLR